MSALPSVNSSANNEQTVLYLQSLATNSAVGSSGGLITYSIGKRIATRYAHNSPPLNRFMITHNPLLSRKIPGAFLGVMYISAIAWTSTGTYHAVRFERKGTISYVQGRTG